MIGAVRGDVVINEILYRPGTGLPENTSFEFVELLNTSSKPADVSGWRFSKGVTFTFPAGCTIPAGGFLVVRASPVTFRVLIPDVANEVGGWTGQLSNSGERVELMDGDGTLIDTVEYAEEGDWAVRVGSATEGWTWVSTASTGGASLELINPLLPRDRGQNWRRGSTAGGTPGAANTGASNNIAPLISAVRHSPALPTSSDPVTISCEIEDENPGLITAVVFWRVATSTSPGSYASIPLSRETGNRFTGSIPPQADGAVIEFFVRTSDGTNARTWPAPDITGQQITNALYQVGSAVETGTTPHYRLIVTGLELETHNTRPRSSETDINVTLVASDPSADEGYSVRYLCGMRLRGNSSRSYNPPPLRISIPGDNSWGDIAAMNLNTRYPWLQVAGMRMLSANGIASPDARAVRVSLNGIDRSSVNTTLRGLHAHLEPVDSNFVRKHYPNDSGGNLYAKRSSATIGGFQRDRIRWGVVNESTIRYNTPGWWVQERWDKDTNNAVNDWTDLTDFVRTMNTASGPTYKDQVGARINIEQWLRWLAILTLFNDYETNLSNGIDDDYGMYRGETDPRFVLIPHDLDTIFGQGDTIGPATGSLFPFVTALSGVAGDDRIPQLIAFINHPEIRSRYFAILRELLAGPFSKIEFDAFLRNHVGGWVSQTTLNNMISWMDQRRNFALANTIQTLGVASALPVQNGFRRTTASTASLNGTFDLVATGTIRVNGSVAARDYTSGQWSITGVSLLPGINRITVQSFGLDGKLLDTRFIDIWFDSGTPQALSGPVIADQTLTATGGPYIINDVLTVEPGATLTVAAGTNLWFAPDAQLVVKGTLRILGTEFAHVRCCPSPTAPNVPDPLSSALPTGPPKWRGVRLIDSSSGQNVIRWTDILHAQDSKDVNQGSIGVIRSRVELDQLSFAGTRLRMLYTDSASVRITNSSFADMFATAEDPVALELQQTSQHIKGVGQLPVDGFYAVSGNSFGTNKGSNDVIEVVSGRRPHAVVQILNNKFLPGGERHVDVQGDAFVAGNFFTGAEKAAQSTVAGYASGVAISGDGATGAVVRNVFHKMDHALSLHEGAAAFFENNTVVEIRPEAVGGPGVPNGGAAVSLFAPGAEMNAGFGAFVQDNVFFGAERLFGNADLPEGVSQLELRNNLITSAIALSSISAARPQTVPTIGSGDFVAEPQFANAAQRDFALLPFSAGTGAGSFGHDVGASVSPEILITGEPASPASGTASLQVGGAGIFAFRYRVNEGPWSDEIQIAPETFPRHGPVLREGVIQLNDLPPGEYRVFVIGRDFAGNWQQEPTASIAWTVNSSVQRVVISELLAANRSVFQIGGAFPDFVELHNPGATAVNLSGKSISDDPLQPRKFVFPPGTIIPAGGYLTLIADTTSGPGVRLGFGLNERGEGVYLYDAPSNGGLLLDSVVFGLQVPDLSIARVVTSGEWKLAKPTPGGKNVAQPLGNSSAVRINEWLAASDVRFRDDFVELFNPSSYPAALGGMGLSDAPYTEPSKYIFPQLSFMPARGFATLRSGSAADELPFSLSADFEMIGLFANDGRLLHLVDFDGERNDISQGFFPDGGALWADMVLPTPGTANLTSGTVHQRMMDLLNGLRISELMYHPAGHPDLEFVELVNIGTTTLDLTGVRFIEGIDFVFPSMNLTPGGRVLVVLDQARMFSTYGSDLHIAGEFTGRLDNSGERITLALPVPYDAAILSFRYLNSWHPATAGGGASLEIVSPSLPPRRWNDSQAWSPSVLGGGSPAPLLQPMITSPLTATGTIGSSLSYQITAEQSPTRFTAEGLPPGLSINSITGVINGTPTAFGTFPVTIAASNRIGTDTRVLSLAIAASGALTSFTWDPLPPTQQATAPFAVRLTARDAQGRTVRSFSGTANLTGSPATLQQVGTSTTQWEYPIGGSLPAARTQVIYLASQLMNEGLISSLALYVSEVPGADLENWTIRLKHTEKTAYSTGAEWESDEWVTVYRANQPITGTGWLTFEFETPFYCDGQRNLMVDYSYNRTSPGGTGFSRYTNASVSRSLVAESSSAGDPLQWAGSVPPPTTSTFVPNARFNFTAPDVTVSPSRTGDFIDGVWAGTVSLTPGLLFANQPVRLVANDGTGRIGSSNLFKLTAAPAPIITSPTSVVAVSGQPFSYRITATGAPESYHATEGPPGLSVDATTGVLSGVIVGPGTRTAVVAATNAGGTGAAEISIEVLADTDGDGLPDSWETLYGFDPNVRGDELLDFDGDGDSNLSEYLSGTLPTDNRSLLEISGLEVTGPAGRDLKLTWSAVPGQRYRVLTATDLKTGQWTDLTPIPLSTDGTSGTFTHVDAFLPAARFYRVELVR
jgi:hypothetical protein